MSQDYDEITISVVNQLFRDLFAIKPAFKNAFDSDIDLQHCKRQWMAAFKDAGIDSIERLKLGIKKTRLKPSPFFPSPGEFIVLCQPTYEDIGAPDIENAYVEACLHANPASWSNKWSHKAVHHAYQRTGANTFLSSNADKTFKKFEQNYIQACQDFGNGRIMDQLEHEKPLSKSELDKPEIIGKYEFSRPGVLRQYENVRSCEEAMTIMTALLDKQKGNNALKALIQRIEARYKEQFGDLEI